MTWQLQTFLNIHELTASTKSLSPFSCFAWNKTWTNSRGNSGNRI